MNSPQVKLRNYLSVQICPFVGTPSRIPAIGAKESHRPACLLQEHGGWVRITGSPGSTEHPVTARFSFVY
jgi:hypothetical protein